MPVAESMLPFFGEHLRRYLQQKFGGEVVT